MKSAIESKCLRVHTKGCHAPTSREIYVTNQGIDKSENDQKPRRQF